MKTSEHITGKIIAVTGGCGFIGSYLVQRLLDLGAQKVIVIDSLEFGKKENINNSDPRVKLLVFKIGTDPIGRLEAELKDCDILFHLAAQKHNQSLKYPHAIYDSNIIGTADLYDLAGRCGVKKVIFSSSLYAYGKLSVPAMLETDLPTPKTIYGISKLGGEHLLQFFSEKYHFDHLIFRFFFVYGPKQYSGLGYKSVIVKNFERLLRSEAPIIYGDGQQALDYIYIEDVIDVLISGVTPTNRDEILNVGSGEAITVLELTKLMSEIAHYVAAPIYEDQDWTAGTVRLADISKIKNYLKWEPKTLLVTGLRETFNWLKY